MIGVGGFGFGSNLPAFMRNADVDVVAICDVYEPHLDRAVALMEGKPKRHRDYHRLLDDRDVDAVVITTPEHWHAIMPSTRAMRGRTEEPNQPPPPPTTDSRAPGIYYTTEILPELSDSSVQHAPHVRNFLDCVKSRNRPIADIEAAHYTNTALRLGNISYRVGRTLRCDAAKEQIAGDAEGNQLAIGTYREPWKPKGLLS